MPAPDLYHEPAAADMPAAVRTVFAGAALARFLAAHERLAKAGYGAAIPRGFIQSAPQVGASVDIPQALALAEAASRIAIRTRPRIAALFLEVSVPMARRLATPRAFEHWVKLVMSLLKPAPESVEPFLAQAEMLHERLGSEPLEMWVLAGLRLGARDPIKRRAYFALELPEALHLLARYAGEENFQSFETELRAGHIALWGHCPPLCEAVTQDKGPAARRASFDGGIVQLPASFAGYRGQEKTVYKAALAHIGAHIAYGGPRFSLGQMKPLQIAVVSLIEDARVEHLALRDMPGLARLWQPFHTAEPEGMATAPSLLARLARALIDPDFPIRHGWVRKGVTLFSSCKDRLSDPAISRQIGNILGNDLGQTRVQFNARDYVVQPDYRDDNLGLWDLPHSADMAPQQHRIEIHTQEQRQTENSESPQERQHALSDPQPEPGAEKVSAAIAADGAGRIVGKLAEYDYLTQSERADWVTVRAYEPDRGDPLFWRKLEARHGFLLSRIAALVRASALGRAQRQKRQAEGETLDLDAAIESAIALRSGKTPDQRVYENITVPERSIAVHLLLDISQSTGDPIGADGMRVISVLRDAAAVLAHAMDRLGDPLAISAFASDGREDLRIVPVKRFEDKLSPLTGMALSGLRPGYSTRIGAAIRYAGASLARVGCHRRLVLVVTDGEPSDIDVNDPEYLVRDARRAVQSVNASGIDVFCIVLGKAAGQRHQEIFTRRGFLHIDHLEALPEKLPLLYFQISR
ncbi:MAG: VWA domain-containing protein [Roseinatronobacter sp.]|nr:VWA domain-containing protein [Roseinatronobacter sp.]